MRPGQASELYSTWCGGGVMQIAQGEPGWKVPPAIIASSGTLPIAGLASGGTLPDARLAYVTHGTLDADRGNAILFPTHYSGTHADNLWLIGEGKALDPLRYFIIVPNMLGNGVSSSPSNTPPPYDGAAFPHVTALDNVECQHRLLTEQFGALGVPVLGGLPIGHGENPVAVGLGVAPVPVGVDQPQAIAAGAAPG